ncbi:MAG TPA: fumarate hydratase [Dehalococcoidia bacterium]|nr:fumarate hydratase [Dehalococcoidia bacterium]
MRDIDCHIVAETVSSLFKEACFSLPQDVLSALERAREKEISPAARGVLETIIENATIASIDGIPLCQDTGVAVVFLEIGQEVHITGGDLNSAVQDGVRLAYDEGYLRKSIVDRPFSLRTNTGDNTPAIIHADIVSGDKLVITAMPKGGGAENMTRLKMLFPADGRSGVIDFVVRTVDESGGNPCPPLIIGVGIGGTAEYSLLLAKKALLRPIGEPNPDLENAELEKEILEKVNSLGIGPMGFGGLTTALAIHVETHPAHIASLPVAVNLQCHSARQKKAVL